MIELWKKLKPILERTIIVAGWTLIGTFAGVLIGAIIFEEGSSMIDIFTWVGGIIGFIWGWKSDTMWFFF